MFMFGICHKLQCIVSGIVIFMFGICQFGFRNFDFHVWDLPAQFHEFAIINRGFIDVITMVTTVT